MQPPTAASPQKDKENQVPGTKQNAQKRSLDGSTTTTVAAAAVTTRGQCRLLSLPAEIRHMIVGYLANDPVRRYGSGVDEIYSHATRTWFILPQRLLHKKFGMTIKAAGLKYPVYIHQPVDISLLLVCRQFYHDAVAVLFREQEIHIEVGDHKVLTRFSRNVMSTLPPSLRGGTVRLHLHVRFADRCKSHKPQATHINQSVHAAIRGINQLALDLPKTPLASLKISWFESSPLFDWADRKRILSTLRKLRPCQIEVGALEHNHHSQSREPTDLRGIEGPPFDVDYLQTLVIRRYLPVLAPEKKYAQALAAKEEEDVEMEL